MTIKDASEDILRKLWLENPTIAPSYIQDDVATAMNAAYQELWLAPEDFFRRKTETVNTAGGTAVYVLPDSIQEIIGPIRVNAATDLVPILDESTFNHFGTRVLGQLTESVAQGLPTHYYADRSNQSGSDNVKLSLWLAPTPDQAYSVEARVSTEPPKVTTAQFTGTDDLEVPHNYAEALYLPVARFHATRSHYFSNEADRAGLTAAYGAALSKLGFSDAQIRTMTKQEEAAA